MWGRSSHSEITDSLWREYVRTRKPETRALLLEQYMGLVHHEAREAARRHSGMLELDDLLSAGTVGLVQALEGFDLSRGTAFSTFAVPRIRGAIKDEIRSWDWLPRSVRARNRKLRDLLDRLRHRLGREPEPAEAAEALGVDLETWWKMADTLRDPVVLSINPADGGDDEFPDLEETLGDPRAVDQSELLEHGESLAELAEAFAALGERDRLILNLSYYEKLTLLQIGEILHLSESRVSQLRTRALQRLTAALEPRREAA